MGPQCRDMSAAYAVLDRYDIDNVWFGVFVGFRPIMIRTPFTGLEHDSSILFNEVYGCDNNFVQFFIDEIKSSFKYLY